TAASSGTSDPRRSRQGPRSATTTRYRSQPADASRTRSTHPRYVRTRWYRPRARAPEIESPGSRENSRGQQTQEDQTQTPAEDHKGKKSVTPPQMNLFRQDLIDRQIAEIQTAQFAF